MGEKKSAIVFHDDIDGIVSAALYCHFNEIFTPTLHPAQSTRRSRLDKVLLDFKSRGFETVVLDYAYSEHADVWFDHHMANRKVREMYDVRQRAKSIGGKCDFREQSCAQIVLDYYRGKDDPRATELCEAANMYDTAKFPTSDFVFKNKSPFNILYAGLENANIKARTHMSSLAVVGLIHYLRYHDCSIDDVVGLVGITGGEVDTLMNRAKGARKHMVKFGDLIISQCRFGEIPRYAEYMPIGEKRALAKYACKIEALPQSKVFKVSLSYNGWHHESNMLDIGKFLMSLNYLPRGGGHFNVGGGEIKYHDIDRFINNVTETFSGDFFGGVDKES